MAEERLRLLTVSPSQSQIQIQEDAIMELPARRCFGAEVIMPSQSVWILLFLLLSQSLATLGLSAVIINTYEVSDAADDDNTPSKSIRNEHLACSAFVILNEVFEVFYVLHGVFRRRREDLLCFALTAIVVGIDVVYDFFVHGDQIQAVHIARCVLVVIFAPFNISAVLYIFRIHDWQEARKSADKRKTTRSMIFAIQKLLLQCIAVLALINIPLPLSILERSLTASLGFISLVGVVVGWKVVSRHWRAMLPVVAVSNLPYEIALIVLLAVRYSTWTHANTHAYITSVIIVSVLVILDVSRALLFRRWWQYGPHEVSPPASTIHEPVLRQSSVPHTPRSSMRPFDFEPDQSLEQSMTLRSRPSMLRPQDVPE